MSTQLYPLTVKSIKKETPDCVSVSFDIPQELTSIFGYKPGQYLALETEINGEKVRRSYSLCSSPYEAQWQVAIKEIPEGKFSTFANQVLKEGDTLDVLPPSGTFCIDIDASQKKNHVAFGAGSGITPILSMIRSVLEKEPESTFTLFYGNKSFEYIIFREEIENLKNIYMDRLTVHHVLSREKLGSPLFYGRIDGEKCREYNKLLFDVETVDAYYLCGPAAMIFDVKDTLIELGAAEKSIHFELFNTDGIAKKEVVEEAFDPNQHSKVTVELDGDSTEITLDYGGLNILDAAIENGIDLPYACKGGVCSTCKAKVKKGEVTMDINYALEPDELKAGYVLTCQAHPRTPETVVSFDE